MHAKRASQAKDVLNWVVDLVGCLHAKVATLVGAAWLFLLTDVPALYSANPQRDPTAVPIREVHDIMQLQVRKATRIGNMQEEKCSSMLQTCH